MSWTKLFIFRSDDSCYDIIEMHILNFSIDSTTNKGNFIQVISLEGWTDIMYYVQDAHSFWNWIYFVLLIIVSFLYVNEVCYNNFY